MQRMFSACCLKKAAATTDAQQFSTKRFRARARGRFFVLYRRAWRVLLKSVRRTASNVRQNAEDTKNSHICELNCATVASICCPRSLGPATKVDCKGLRNDPACPDRRPECRIGGTGACEWTFSPDNRLRPRRAEHVSGWFHTPRDPGAGTNLWRVTHP